MKKIVVNKTGGPEAMECVDFDLNSTELLPNNVRIKHKSIGVNFIDTYHRSGLYPAETPFTPGLEAVGEIIDVGSEVGEFVVGDRVGYSSPPLGAYSEVRDISFEKIFKIPESVGDDEAASLLLKGMTVEYLFNRTFAVTSQTSVLFHAAAGGVGLISCQWARAIGCKIIGTVGSEEKISLAKNNGCEHVINYKKEDVVSRVMDITGGEGVDVVYDGVGKDTFDISINCLKKRGGFVSFGNASGMTPKTDLFAAFAPKNLYFTRPSLMVYNNTRGELLDSSSSLFKMILNKKIKPNIFKTYNLNDVVQAHKDLELRKTVGSIILKP